MHKKSWTKYTYRKPEPLSAPLRWGHQLACWQPFYAGLTEPWMGGILLHPLESILRYFILWSELFSIRSGNALCLALRLVLCWIKWVIEPSRLCTSGQTSSRAEMGLSYWLWIGSATSGSKPLVALWENWIGLEIHTVFLPKRKLIRDGLSFRIISINYFPGTKALNVRVAVQEIAVIGPYAHSAFYLISLVSAPFQERT